MAGKRLYTEADVRALARGARLVLGPDSLATPSALDAAFELGIAVVRGDASSISAGNSAGSGGCGCGGACGGAAGGCTWSKMLSSDATYVVVVTNGKASVARMTPTGPVPFA